MNQPTTPVRPRFSLRKLLGCLAVYACLFGILGALPVPMVQIAAATGVVTLFVILDLVSSRPDDIATPTWARYSQFVAYHATAFAIAFAICFAIHLVTPKPPVPPKPALSFLAVAYMAVTGQLHADFRAALESALAEALTAAFTYLVPIVVFSTVGFIASLISIRRFRSAKWLAAINSPGVLVWVFAFFQRVDMRMDQPSTPARPRRRWFRYCLRTLIVFVTLAGGRGFAQEANSGVAPEKADSRSAARDARTQFSQRKLADWEGEYSRPIAGFGSFPIGPTRLFVTRLGYILEHDGSTEIGRVERIGNVVTLEPGDVYGFSYKDNVRTFVIIPWKTRRYLVPLRMIVSYCNEINATGSARGASMVPILSREMNRDEPVQGLPAVPCSYRRYLLRRPVDGEIVATRREVVVADVPILGVRRTGNKATMRMQPRSTLLPGMELRWAGVAEPTLFRATVVAVRNGVADVLVERIYGDQPIKKGLRFSTRFPKLA